MYDSLLEEIMKYLPAGIVRFSVGPGEKCVCDYLNAYARELAGIKEKDELPDARKLFELIPKWERETVMASLADARKNGQAIEWEGELVTHRGLRSVRIVAHCVLDPDSNVMHIDGTIEDIMNKRREIDRTENILKKVRELNEKFDEFKTLYDNTKEPAKRPDLDILSERERMVAELILEGYTNRQISDKLFISESTVKKHTNAIFRKIEIHGRNDLFLLETT